MWCRLNKPSCEQLDAIVQAATGRQPPLPHTYEQVGASRSLHAASQTPAGYDLDGCRTSMGRGDAVFAAACQALRRWEMFSLTWAGIHPAAPPIVPATVVMLVARGPLIWATCMCRIVYVIDEPRHFGFGYGTLALHPERGEERFLVEQGEQGEVWFEIRAFSRPQTWLSWLSYPVMRHYQARFRRDAPRAMRRAVDRAMAAATGALAS